jgi:superfamily II DNA or RNA helicase
MTAPRSAARREPHDVVQRLARAALATRGLDAGAPPIAIGRITLMPHQAAAVQWLLPRLKRFGGALLADPPGLGKTYVALAAAAACDAVPLVIAPAALRTRWQDAARETDVPIRFVSTERLSAPAPLQAESPAFVIVDEAHHVRTRGTRRHQRAATLCAKATVLLLTATPIQNRPHDLEHITRLFHLPPTRQSAAWLRRRLTLRRTLEQVHTAFPALSRTLALPVVLPSRTLSLTTRHHALPDAIERLPPLGRTGADATEGHRLLQLGLLHALRSSDAAARERIQHRIAATVAIEAASEAGITVTAQLRKAWQSIGGDVQLAMPSLLATPDARAVDDRLCRAARVQRAALEVLLPSLGGQGDAERAAMLRRLARWSAQPVVAFTQFSATARGMFQRLRHETGIALLTGEGARIATGQIPRAEALQRLLSPRYGARHEAVRLLIATDVLSEGLSLAGVATIVHLDLPWTAARLDQRVGRAARIGAPVRAIRVVTLPAALPASASDALHTLLRRKRRRMSRVGTDGDAACITSLRTLVDVGVSGRPVGRWLTLQTASGREAVTIAIVRTRRDRWLVVQDDKGLRRARASDWCALACAAPAPTPALARRGHVSRLRHALAGWLADAELCALVRDSNDDRLLSRRTIDEMLVRSERGTRAQQAATATAKRRNFGTGALDAGSSAQNGRRRDVAVLCGVHLVAASAI